MFGLKSGADRQAQWFGIAHEVNTAWELLVIPWRDNMIGLFTNRIGAKMIFNDDHPEDELQPELKEFQPTIEEHLKTILPDVNSHLVNCERRSRELGLLTKYDGLMNQNINSLLEYMGKQSALIGARLLIGRWDELGRPVDHTLDLFIGRKLIKEVRASPVEMTPELLTVVGKALDLIEQHEADSRS